LAYTIKASGILFNDNNKTASALRNVLERVGGGIPKCQHRDLYSMVAV
jgi:hypothetical protein